MQEGHDGSAEGYDWGMTGVRKVLPDEATASPAHKLAGAMHQIGAPQSGREVQEGAARAIAPDWCTAHPPPIRGRRSTPSSPLVVVASVSRASDHGRPAPV